MSYCQGCADREQRIRELEAEVERMKQNRGPGNLVEVIDVLTAENSQIEARAERLEKLLERWQKPMDRETYKTLQRDTQIALAPDQPAEEPKG